MKKILLFGWLLFLAGCKSADRSPSPNAPLPAASEQPGEILVVAEQDVWQGAAGDTFRHYFQAPYLLLPEPEPVFDIRHLTPEQFSNLPEAMAARCIVLLADQSASNSFFENILPGSEVRKTGLHRNLWATEQLVFILDEMGQAQLASAVGRKYGAIACQIHEAQRLSIRQQLFAEGKNEALSEAIQKRFNLKISLPAAWQEVHFDEQKNVMWVQKREGNITQNLLFHHRLANGKTEFSAFEMKKLHDEITAGLPGFFMRASFEKLPPIVGDLPYHEGAVSEMRGLWQKSDAEAVVPFISQVKADGYDVWLLDAFLEMKEGARRQKMQEMEALLF